MGQPISQQAKTSDLLPKVGQFANGSTYWQLGLWLPTGPEHILVHGSTKEILHRKMLRDEVAPF